MIDSPQEESFCILQEECAEVIQIISKIKRWGGYSNNNGKLVSSNREQLIQELGDLMTVMYLTCHYHGISDQELDAAIKKKWGKLKIYSNLVKTHG